MVFDYEFCGDCYHRCVCDKKRKDDFSNAISLIEKACTKVEGDHFTVNIGCMYYETLTDILERSR